MAVYGGDLAQLEALSRQFLTEIDAVDGLQSRISGALETTAWSGPAAERFRTQWPRTSCRRCFASRKHYRRAPRWSQTGARP